MGGKLHRLEYPETPEAGFHHPSFFRCFLLIVAKSLPVKKKVPSTASCKWQEMIDHSISITKTINLITTVTMTLTKVGGDEEGLIELLNYNMELGRMVTTMAKNVFWVRTCSQR